MNDFEAHEGSYDHQHRKRAKEVKQLTKQPNAPSKAERERKANEEAGMVSIDLSLVGAGGSSTKKKPKFISTLQRPNPPVEGQLASNTSGPSADNVDKIVADPTEEALWQELENLEKDPENQVYDPRYIRGWRTNANDDPHLPNPPKESWGEYCRGLAPKV